MIPSSSALVSLKPARQAALQAIMTVEEARQRGARLLFTDSFFSMAGMIFPMVAAVLLARSIEWY